MTRDDKVAILVERWIPDSLRLSEDHDARLVSSAITTVIGAIYDSDRMTMQGQSPEVREALSRWTDTIYAEHMAKEREHYASMEEKASRAVPTLHPTRVETWRRSKTPLFTFFLDSKEGPSGRGASGRIEFVDGMYVASVVSADSEAMDSSEDPISALRGAVSKMGFALSDSTAITDAINVEMARRGAQ